MIDLLKDCISLTQLAYNLNISKQAVISKRGIADYYIAEGPNPAGTGRPVKYFDIKALQLWGKSLDKIIELKKETMRKCRDDNGIPRIPQSFSKENRIELKNHIVIRTYELWMEQARLDNVLPCCINACIEYCRMSGQIEDFNSPEEMADYYYQKWIKRNDSYYQGHFYKDNWVVKHNAVYNIRGTNELMPKNRWDYIPLLTDYGLIGEGSGAGDLWIIDGSDLDTFVNIDGKISKLKYIQILDGVTRYPMLVRPIISESIEIISKIIAEAYTIYGIPRLGVMLDNSRAFSSTTIEYLIKSFYTRIELENFKTDKWCTDIFKNEKKAPLYFNIPNIPRYKFKALIERSFRSHNQFVSSFNPPAYTGSGWGNGVSLDLSTMPITPMKYAKEIEEVWNNFIYNLYNVYIYQKQNTSLKSFSTLTGKKPEIIEAWQYYGGLENGRKNFKSYPKENEANLYYLTPDDRVLKHRVEVTDYGHLKITHQNEEYNYHCPELTPDYLHKKVCVIPIWNNPEESYIYLEHNPKKYDERITEPGMVYFIGKGSNHFIRSRADIGKIQKRRVNQNIQQNWLDNAVKNMKITHNPKSDKPTNTPKPMLRKPDCGFENNDYKINLELINDFSL